MLDELPTSALLDEAGEIDAVRFPNLAGLAEDGAWYPSYSTSSAFTVTAVPAILSGKPPTADPPIFTRHPENLFSLLAPTHDLHVVETVTELCDPTTCRPTGSTRGVTAIVSDLLADGASAYGERLLGGSTRNAFEDVELDLESTVDDHLAEEFQGVQQRPHVLTELLETIEPADEPALWFAHLMLPHQPWVLYPDGSTYDRTGFRPGNSSEPWLRAIAEQRLLLQLQYTDALVGEALDALRRAGEYDDAIVVVTGDHGVSLVPGTPRRALDPDTVEPLAYAPLIIKGPAGRQPEPDGSNVTSADLLPTIAALAGVDVPWELAGHPIGSRSADQPRAHQGGVRLRLRLVAGLREDAHLRAPAGRATARRSADRGPPAGGPPRSPGSSPSSTSSRGSGAPSTTSRAARCPRRRPSVGGSPGSKTPMPRRPGSLVAALHGDVQVDDVVLLAVNGAVVTAAPLRTSGAAQRGGRAPAPAGCAGAVRQRDRARAAARRAGAAPGG